MLRRFFADGTKIFGSSTISRSIVDNAYVQTIVRTDGFVEAGKTILITKNLSTTRSRKLKMILTITLDLICFVEYYF